MPTDVITNKIVVGDIVNIPCEVTATGGTPQKGVDLLTLKPKYKTPDDSVPSNITSVYATQVIKDR